MDKINDKKPMQKVNKKNKIQEDVYGTTSNLKGIAGFAETLLRKFRTGAFLAALLPVYMIGILAMGIAATPGVYCFHLIAEITRDWLPLFHYLVMGITLVAGYFMYGLSIIFVIPFFNFIMPFRLKPFRGSYFSLSSVPWYIHNALLYIVRFTFLDFVTPTPLNTLFYRMMGMKIGKGVHINTSNISDACLIELDDHVTIGGSAHIIAHYAAKGYLVLAPVKIKKGATVGLKATVMGDVEIGEGATIGPHEIILPKSRIPAGRKPTKEQLSPNPANGKAGDSEMVT